MEEQEVKNSIFEKIGVGGLTNDEKLYLRNKYNTKKGTNHKNITRIRRDLENMYDFDFGELDRDYEDESGYDIAYDYIIGYLFENENATQNEIEWVDVFDNVKVSETANERIDFKEYYEDYEYNIPIIIENQNDILEPIIEIIDTLHNQPLVVFVMLYGYDTSTEEKNIYKIRTTIARHNNKTEILNEIKRALKKMYKQPSTLRFVLTGFGVGKISSELGGGYSKNYNVKSVKNYDVLSMKNIKNNCLFDCIDYYKKDKIKQSQIKEIRKDEKLNGEINMSNAILIGKKYFDLDLSFYIEKDENIVLITDETPYKILIKDNHYSILINRLKNYEIIHYDIETYKNNYFIHTPYIIGFCYYLNEKLQYETIEGDNCLDLFYELMGTEKFKNYKYINAYNGSNFDFHLLLKYALKYERFENKKDVIISNGSILSYEYQGKKIVDLNKHILGKLANNLKEYKCDVLKGDIDHNLSKRWEETDELRREEVKKYLKSDVMGLCELYNKMNDEIFNEFHLNICDYLTSSQLYDFVSKGFMDSETRNKIKPQNIEITNILRNALYGGRCEVYKHKYTSKHKITDELKYDDVEDYLFCGDKVSLYPSVMEKYDYPIGSAKHTNIFMKDYMGIYEIEYITNKTLTIAILPKKINKELIWDLKDGEGWFSSIDIKNAIDFGYKIKRIKQGYYWTEKAPIFKDYINSMIRKKQSTDKTLYPSKYNMYKTAMNAIYGKQLQKDILQKTTIIEKISDLLILMKTNDCLISEFNYGNKILVEYEPHYIETLISKRPVEIGIFILSYSRLEMLKEFKKYDNIESMPYYTDTDSIYIESKYLDKSNIGKELGMISNDFGDGKILSATFISPKLYSVIYIKSDNKIYKECVGKGVQNELLCVEDYDKLLNGEEINYTKSFQIKKGGLNIRNMKKKGDKCLDLKHNENVVKRIKMNKEKRLFNGNVSIPNKS
jgi:hypothetical protein